MRKEGVEEVGNEEEEAVKQQEGSALLDMLILHAIISFSWLQMY